VRVWWRAFGSPSESSLAEISVRDAAGIPLPGFSTSDTGSFWDTTGGPQELDFPASAKASLVEVGERCASSCASQTGLLYSGIPLVVQLFGAELTLTDSTPPTVTLTSSPEASAPTSGMITLAFYSNDPAVGIAKNELLVDGAPVATHQYGNACTYTQLRPCPESESDQLSVQGATLTEGAHQLTIRATDAAGNTALSATRTVTTIRPPVPNGNPCANPAISLALNGKPPISFGEPAAIEGRLACANTPIAGATLSVAASSIIGGRTENLGGIHTAADGTFRYTIAPGASRKLTFSYDAYSNQSSPSAQASFQVAVRPRITLRIDRHRTHNHGEIRWAGRVEGGPYPSAGVTLLTQVQEITVETVRRAGRLRTIKHAKWKTFHEITARNGEISFAYRFRRTFRPTTYTFRVATPADGAAGYEYAPSASNAVRVYVGPRARRPPRPTVRTSVRSVARWGVYGPCLGPTPLLLAHHDW
jgi:hypothetical protein